MNLEKKCPFCKRIISIDDNYCPYCGYSVENIANSNKKIDKIAETIPPLQKHPAAIPLIKEEKAPETKISAKNKEEKQKIPEEIIEQHYIRIKIKKYDEKLKDYKEKIANLLSNLNEEELTEIQDEIPKLKESIDKLKQKRKTLLDQKKPLPHESLLNERQKLKKRLSNLFNKFHLKEIEAQVYEKLKQEYETKLNEINVKIKDKYHFDENWKKLLQKDIEKHEERLKILEGRLKVGELSKNDYENEKMNIKKNVDKLSLLLSELKF